MSDRQKVSYPTAPIAWMSQAYETNSSTPSSPISNHEQSQPVKPISSSSFTGMNPSSTMHSLER